MIVLLAAVFLGIPLHPSEITIPAAGTQQPYLLSTAAGRLDAPKQPPSLTQTKSDSEAITIDGSKNPELIPQWAIWEFALSTFAKNRDSSQDLPTAVLRTVSPGEKAFIFRHADAWQASNQKCIERVMAVYTDAFGSAPPKTVNGRPLMDAKTLEVDRKMHAITLECRWNTLHVRDRVLSGINPEAHQAMVEYAESLKQGMKSTGTRKAIERYREPQ